MEPNNHSIKIIIAGDKGVGKSSLLFQYSETDVNMMEKIERKINRNFSTCSVDVNGIEKILIIYEIEENDVNRELIRDAHVILLCFSVIDRVSMNNIKRKWVRLLKDYCFKKRKHRNKEYLRTDVILVGTKINLRDDKEILKELEKQKLTPVTYTEGYELCKEIKALYYLEGGIDGNNSKHIFDEAISCSCNRSRFDPACSIC